MSRRLRATALILFLALLGIALAACSGPGGAEPTPTATPAATATVEPTSTAQPTAAPEPTPSPTATPEPTLTPPPSPSPTPTPPQAAEPVTITRADTSEKIVALTFDAGADAGYVDQILDTLAHEGIHATFGMTGVWAEQYPDAVRRIVAEGHQMINHTYDHPSFTGFSTNQPPLSREERIATLQHTEDVIRQIVDYDMRPYFRPPYGDYDDSVMVDIAEAGYTVNVLWSVDSLGWKGLTAQEIADRCVSMTEPGGIILMHVGSQSQDAAALPDIIARLRADGYRFVTIKDMVGR